MNIETKTNLVVAGALIVSVSMLFGFAGYFLGVQQKGEKSQAEVQLITNEQSNQASFTTEIKKVVVPSSWKSFSAVDSEWGLKTTLSLPYGFSFQFKGSEFVIQDDSSATELWSYFTSVYGDKDGIARNHYGGESRRAWYEKRLADLQPDSKVVGVEEKQLNTSSYLVLTVQSTNYNSKGKAIGTKNGKHYLYIQNKILHIFQPASNLSYTQSAQIPKNIEPILASLKTGLID